MDEVSEEVNLMEIPAKRHSLSAISLQANLMQAHEKILKWSRVVVCCI